MILRKENFTVPIEQDFENLPLIKEKSAVPKKRLMIFVSAFGVVLILLLITAVFTGFSQNLFEETDTEKPMPKPITESRKEITSPSPYATDAAILKIEEEVEKLDKKIQETDLKETDLTPPTLDWEVEFEE